MGDIVIGLFDKLEIRGRAILKMFTEAAPSSGLADGEMHLYEDDTDVILQVRSLDLDATKTIGHSSLTDGTNADALHTHDTSHTHELEALDATGETDGHVLTADGAGGAAFEAIPTQVPSGLIAMWHGLLANIPSGWVLCDGTNGTPDLRDRFVVGAAAAANPGTTGGASTHQHDAAGSHTHTASADGSGTFAVGDGEVASTQADHQHAAASSLPPFYAVAFIMKT